jgi:NarL family two-component system sensor histidine kinase YdfH
VYRFPHKCASSLFPAQQVQHDIVLSANIKFKKIQYNQNMDEIYARKEKNLFLPGYIFFTILLGGLGIYGFYINWKANQPVLAALSAILVTAHIGLYWLNLRQFHHPRWWVFYYSAQTILIIVIATLPYSGEASLFGISFLGTATISITGEILGLWGNTRRAFLLGLFYLSILLVIIFSKVEPDLILPYLAQFLTTIGFIVILMVVFNLQIRERQKAEELAETLESANAKLAAYAARNEGLTLQAERERMARELHDTLAQGVAGLILQLEALKEHQQQNRYPQAQSVLEQAIARARSTLGESRAAIENLRNDKVDFKEAVEAMIAQTKSVSKVDYQLTLNLIENRPIPQNIQHHAERVLHEALTNINKHAGAAQAQINIEQKQSTLSLHITDDGIGFDTNQPYAEGCFGLQGLAERARLTHSQYMLTSTPGAGTTIEFIFPLERESL